MKYTGGTLWQTYVPNPTKHLGTVSAGASFKKDGTGDHNISGWHLLGIWPTTTNGTLTLNGDANKIIPIYVGQPNIFPIDDQTTEIVISVAAIVCGG